MKSPSQEGLFLRGVAAPRLPNQWGNAAGNLLAHDPELRQYRGTTADD